ncbi:type I restriction enzyme, S subunit, partial [Candidatus Electrothrix aarhusensis]
MKQGEKLVLDKSNWTPVTFGDVVQEPKESVKNAAAAGIERVVGLEHIDSENVHLRRFAGIEESTTFTKKFSKGDVLFGRRRAYLKKAAQTEFEGICSGDITVMRAKDNLLPELLPFIVQNEKFFDYAIEHSAGGCRRESSLKTLPTMNFSFPRKNSRRNLLSFFGLWMRWLKNILEAKSCYI